MSQATLFGTERFRVIALDYPWSHDNYGMKAHGAAKSHYGEMTVEQGLELPIGDLADPTGSVVAMWSTCPKGGEETAPQRLLKAWGFRCPTRLFTWVKCDSRCQQCGCDYYTHKQSPKGEVPGRCQHRVGRARCLCKAFAPKVVYRTGNYTGGSCEDVWLGVRGSGMSRDRRKRDVRSTVIAPQPCYPGTRRPRHSAKPEIVQDLLERLWAGPYLELFARRQRKGWVCAGDELGQWICKDGVLPLEVARQRGLVPEAREVA